MDTNNKFEGTTLTLVEAVDTLSHIAEIDLDKNIEIIDEESMALQDDSLTYRTIHWIQQPETKDTTPLVREIFRVILKYLKSFYETEYSESKKMHVIEEIKTIMVLVGEAARKLDRLTRVFHKTHVQSVTQLKEYCELQDFYRLNISRTIDDSVIGHWISELTKKGQLLLGQSIEIPREKIEEPTEHIFIDLDSVKKDTEYELFFMRKEDGTRFFNPQLIRNIKLFSDFGGYFGQINELDPLTSMEVWRARVGHACAKKVLKCTKHLIDKFYRNAMKHKDTDVVAYVNEAIMALLLAANPACLHKDPLIKDCADYFADFQAYLHSALVSFDYQRIVVYANANQNTWSSALLDTIHSLCSTLYMQTNNLDELKGAVLGLIECAHEDVSQEHSHDVGCWNKLAGDYAAMTKYLKGHGNGPISIVLEMLERGDSRAFDPLLQGNTPSIEYEVLVGERRYVVARWPTPTTQESINKVAVCEEFKSFLRDGLTDRHYKSCLLVNFQDRLTWKEFFRASALESLNHNKEFTSCIDVVTLAKDTEFYHQNSPYKSENHTHVFIKTFLDQLKESSGGFWFPEDMKKKGGFNEFCKCALEAIHRIFFSSKNTLTRENRQDFIEIFNLFLIMKIVDVTKPDVIGLTCKDGIDVSVGVAAELFVLLKLIHQDVLSKEDMDQLSSMIYAPALNYRERLMIPERFQRMLGAIRLMESTQQQYGKEMFGKIIAEAFGYLMTDPLYNGIVRPAP